VAVEVEQEEWVVVAELVKVAVAELVKVAVVAAPADQRCSGLLGPV